jgi:hypothetical protein
VNCYSSDGDAAGAQARERATATLLAGGRSQGARRRQCSWCLMSSREAWALGLLVAALHRKKEGDSRDRCRALGTFYRGAGARAQGEKGKR